MMPCLTAHTEYLAKHGLLRWVLRECVRANPFYVISAACFAYGILQLNVELQPKIGRMGATVACLALLHVYEAAVLGVATIVLHSRRGAGGGDLHGLTLVAALFMGVSFLALDDLIAAAPALGLLLVPGAIALADLKLSWYARRPGILLPPAYRRVALGILCGHSLSALFGNPAVNMALGERAAQGLAWACGWLSLMPALWLVWSERVTIAAAELELRTGTYARVDTLQTRWCGGHLLFMSAATGLAHLIGSDWVFDRPTERAFLFPWLTMALAPFVLRHWFKGQPRTRAAVLVIAAPAVALHWLWLVRPFWNQEFDWALLAGALPQAAAAAGLFYAALASATGSPKFYWGLAASLCAPLGTAAWSLRPLVVKFRATLSAGAGFVLLIAGMLLSLYRQKLLRWLDPKAGPDA